MLHGIIGQTTSILEVELQICIIMIDAAVGETLCSMQLIYQLHHKTVVIAFKYAIYDPVRVSEIRPKFN